MSFPSLFPLHYRLYFWKTYLWCHGESVLGYIWRGSGSFGQQRVSNKTRKQEIHWSSREKGFVYARQYLILRKFNGGQPEPRKVFGLAIIINLIYSICIFDRYVRLTRVSCRAWFWGLWSVSRFSVDGWWVGQGRTKKASAWCFFFCDYEKKALIQCIDIISIYLQQSINQSINLFRTNTLTVSSLFTPLEESWLKSSR